MDPFHAKMVADVERELAAFLDDLASVFASGSYSKEEIDYAMRYAAGNLRGKADELEKTA